MAPLDWTAPPEFEWSSRRGVDCGARRFRQILSTWTLPWQVPLPSVPIETPTASRTLVNSMPAQNPLMRPSDFAKRPLIPSPVFAHGRVSFNRSELFQAWHHG